ncbi:MULTISPECIES: hypothetical protein [Haloferacaceae]|uniref:Uncharacterized protein n=1 Tax=Halorubrum glutamatedens TaxID=2707018 RepID=A0ABD5QMW5_9EURY|nr:hypothetical protein [Halobellus captivus]
MQTKGSPTATDHHTSEGDNESRYYQVTVYYESASHPGADPGDRQPTHHEQETFDTREEILPWLRNHIHVTETTLKRGGRAAYRIRHGEEIEGRTFGYWCGPDRRGTTWYEWATVTVERIQTTPTAYPEVI